MCRHIVITKTNNLDISVCQPSMITLKEFVNGKTSFDNIKKESNIKFFYDDPFTNFNDLNYWNMEIDFHEKQVKEVKLKIQQIIKNLKENGFSAKKLTKEDKKSFLLPDWWWGRKTQEGNCMTINLPDDERIKIFMYHLEILLKTLKKCKNEWYCWVDFIN